MKLIRKFILLVLIVFLLFIFNIFAENSTDDSQAEVNLLAVGDVMMDAEIGDLIKEKGKSYPLKEVAPILKTGDITFGNLESILGTKNGSPIYKDLKPYNFIASLELSEILKESGFNVMSLANNHAMDYGALPIKETREILLKNRIKFFGAGKNLNESREPAIVEVKGIKFAFLGYSKYYPNSGYADNNNAGVTPINIEYIKEDIQKIRDKVDFVIVSIHWGTEYQLIPTENQKEIAHKIIDYGADMILGHHPHVLQGMEIYKNKFIIYSLGNFLFDMEGKWKDKSIILSCKFSKTSLKSVDIIPLDRFEKYFPKPAEGKEGKMILNKMKEISLPLNSDASVLKKVWKY